VQLEDLPEFAKNSCRRCYGRGWIKKVRNVGKKKWETAGYDLCNCVLKSKRLPELWEKVKTGAERKKKLEDLAELNLKMAENATLAEIDAATELVEAAKVSTGTPE